MTDARANQILQDQAEMESRRRNFDNYWQDISELVAPEYAVFLRRTAEGEEKHNRMFDTTTRAALQNYSALLNTMLTPRNRQWHKLRAKSEAIRNDIDISAWFEKTTKEIFSLRYSPLSNFASQVDVLYIMDGLVGNACLYVDADAVNGMRYRNIHPREIYVKPNHQGIVDHIHRKFTLKGYQAVQHFGDDTPQKITEESQKDNEFNFIHVVKINPNYVLGSVKPEEYKFISHYTCVECPQIIREGGYRTMPYIYNRHMVAPDEDYGRSPAMRLMPTIKILNEKQRTNIRAAQLSVFPPVLLGDVSNTQPFNFRSGALNYGYLLNDGRAMAQPLNLGTRPDIGLEFIEKDQKEIQEAFFVNLYNILVETPNMTATEVMERSQEKAQLLAPVMGRKQSEFLGKLIEREIDVMSFNFGLLDDMPEELAGDNIEFEYETEITRFMQADEGVGIVRSLETAMQVAQADPSVLDVFDLPETIRELTRINGVPAKILRSAEEVKAMKEAQQQNAEAQQVAQIANQLAPAAKVANEAGLI